MRAPRLLLLLSALFACAAAGRLRAQERPPIPYGLEYMARFDRLPTLKDAVCKQISSYDRSGGNGDAGHFLNGNSGHLPNDTALLADIHGPGCIYRLWSANAAGTIRFYFDGEREPRIACPMQDLFLDRYPPFHRPLADHISGGWYSYLPIPFQRGVRIEVEHPGVMYYHVQYHAYPPGTRIRTFTRELTPEDRSLYDTVQHQWAHTGEIPVRLPEGTRRHTGHATLSGGEHATLLRSNSGGTVRALHVRISPATRFTLRNVAIRCYWDGAKSPAVAAPLGDFFGNGFGEHHFRSLPLAMTDEGYSCYFPMPFRRGARIEVTNEGSDPVTLTWDVAVSPPMPGDAPYGEFHARWNRTDTVQGKHVTLLETGGRGHFVGVNLNIQGDRGIGFLEGDEKIYVDGESFPSIYGTGTEDYFTSGWYFDEGPFNRPCHGCIVKDEPHSRITAYRYQITDCVPFIQSIRVDIEHGGENDYPGADYSYTAYWYQEGPTDTWVPLADPARRRPASIKAQNVIEAERLPHRGGAVVSDEHMPVELSGGEGLSVPAHSHAHLTLSVPESAYYTLQFGVLARAEPSHLAAALDGRELGAMSLQSTPPEVRRVGLGGSERLSGGPHTLVLVNNGGADAVLDFVAYRKQLYPGAMEGEHMRVLESTPGVELGPQDLRPFGRGWSNDEHLWFRPNRAGPSFTLELPVRMAGRYRLVVYYTKAIDYGQVQASLDGREVGGVFDGFHDGVIPSGPVELGTMDLTAGAHRLTFRVVGKNARSTGYLVGVDAVALEPR